MELITKLENQVEKWLKVVPHLPAAGQKWLAHNVWWIALVGAIIAGVSLLFSLGALFSAIALLGAVGDPLYGYYVTHGINAWSLVSSVVSLIFLALQGIVVALAVSPLKEMKRKGWFLLFVSSILAAIAVVVNAVLTFNPAGFIFGVLFGAICVAIGLYLVFEIRSHFGGSAKAVKTKKS